MVDHCNPCTKGKRRPNRKNVGLPKAMCFNEVCCIDLKEWVKGKQYILYIVDEFSHLTKCKVLDGKDADTEVKAIIEIWVISGGCSPGMPHKYFFSD